MEKRFTIKQMKPLIWLSIIEVVALVVSNIIVNKNFMFFGYVASASLVFPFLMIATDLISECYGYKISRMISRGALVVSGVVALIYSGIIALPVAAGSEAIQEAMSTLLGQNWMVFVFSSLAFLVSTWINDMIFEKMKKNETNSFFARACISTAVGSVVDCFLFFIPLYLCVLKLPVLVALGMLPSVIAYQVILKAGVECILAGPLTPVTKKLNMLLAE